MLAKVLAKRYVNEELGMKKFQVLKALINIY